VGTYLDPIVDAHRAAAAADLRPVEALLEQAADLPASRPFTAALVADDDLAVIAEVKRRSPSRGPLALDLDPASLAVSYQCGGAACLSVLTDHDFFGGSPADLAEARGACALPVLRKDFTVDERDVVDSRLMGADAVLLIVAALDDDELRRFLDLATALGLDALVEVHDEAELGRAVAAGATLIGVNQRDLTTFEVDRGRAARLAEQMPAGAVTVAESGVRGAEDAVALAAVGYDAVLVGESLVTSADPGAAVIDLRAGG
jgi:indole-3-glycerol phosphate synthase